MRLRDRKDKRPKGRRTGNVPAGFDIAAAAEEYGRNHELVPGGTVCCNKCIVVQGYTSSGSYGRPRLAQVLLCPVHHRRPTVEVFPKPRPAGRVPVSVTTRKAGAVNSNDVADATGFTYPTSQVGGEKDDNHH